jgi:putative tryptophan/tyrosine transport system substrate-binding protein
MRRRDVLKGMSCIGVMLLAAPVAIFAQTTPRVYRIGLFNRGAPVTDASPFGQGLIRGLEKRGYNLGRNLEFERRGARGRFDLLPGLLDELVASKVDVIVAIGYPAAVTAKTGTTVPVVTWSTGDPVGTGLVASLAHPGGHLTGISDMAVELSPKRLQLLKELVPNLGRIAIIWNAADAGMVLRYKTSDAAAKALGISIQPFGVREPQDIDRAFETMARDKPDAVLVIAEALTIANRRRIYDFAAAGRLPALYEETGFLIHDGGLMFYGPDDEESFDRVAALVDRILKGAKPADLPFEQPTRFRFVVNAKTAKSLGLTIPPGILLRADEVIE